MGLLIFSRRRTKRELTEPRNTFFGLVSNYLVRKTNVLDGREISALKNKYKYF